MTDFPTTSDSSRDSLTETRLDSQLVLDGRFLKVRRDIVRLPDGGQTSREFVVHPGAVVVIALLDDGQVLLERQFRYPVGQVMIEFPAGKLDPGEDPLHCGQRELLEETGYRASEWARAGILHLAIGYSTEIIHIYFARGLSAGDPQREEGEFLEVFAAPLDALETACRDGRVTDAKTLSCLLWLRQVQRGDWSLDWQAA